MKQLNPRFIAITAITILLSACTGIVTYAMTFNTFHTWLAVLIVYVVAVLSLSIATNTEGS